MSLVVNAVLRVLSLTVRTTVRSMGRRRTRTSMQTKPTCPAPTSTAKEESLLEICESGRILPSICEIWTSILRTMIRRLDQWERTLTPGRERVCRSKFVVRRASECFFTRVKNNFQPPVLLKGSTTPATTSSVIRATRTRWPKRKVSSACHFCKKMSNLFPQRTHPSLLISGALLIDNNDGVDLEERRHLTPGEAFENRELFGYMSRL